MTHLLGLLGVILISFSPIFVKLAAVSPTTAAFFRMIYALPLLLLAWLFVRGRDTRVPRYRKMAFASGLLLAVDLSFWHRSIELIGAGLATVLGNTQVIFVGLAAWGLHRERPRPLAFAVIPIVFAGASLISGLGQEDAYGTDPLTGTIYGLLTGISYAVFLLVFRASNRGLAPSVGPLLDATAGGALGALLAGVLDARFDLIPHWPAHGWLFALALGSQVAGWLLIAVALPRLPALETSVMLLVQPVLSVLWALVLFDESLSHLQYTGILLVLGGVGLLSVYGSVERNRES